MARTRVVIADQPLGFRITCGESILTSEPWKYTSVLDIRTRLIPVDPSNISPFSSPRTMTVISSWVISCHMCTRSLIGRVIRIRIEAVECRTHVVCADSVESSLQTGPAIIETAIDATHARRVRRRTVIKPIKCPDMNSHGSSPEKKRYIFNSGS